MTQWCLSNLSNKYEMVVVFANTGDEREETLEFVKKCDDIFGFSTVWVEAKVNHNERKASSHKVVNYRSASRDGQPFEDVIKKYGIPNQPFPHCTRELKTNPITSYVKNELGWQGYYTAIGIRVDEFDRMSEKMDEFRYIYPLVTMHPKSKQEINKYWSEMPFRVELKGYEGNCKVCWKKSYRKLMTIAKNNPESFDVFRGLEQKYETLAPRSRSDKDVPFRFFRGNRSVQDVIDMSKNNFQEATDDKIDTNYQTRLFDELDKGHGCEESCEPF